MVNDRKQYSYFPRNKMRNDNRKERYSGNNLKKKTLLKQLICFYINPNVNFKSNELNSTRLHLYSLKSIRQQLLTSF